MSAADGPATTIRAAPVAWLPPRRVVVVSLAVAAAILGDSLLYAVLPSVWPSLGLDLAAVGLLLSANRLIRLASNPFAGWVMGRWGTRWPFAAAVLVGTLTTAVYPLGLGLVSLVLARLTWGVSWSFLRLGGFIAALESAGDHRRGYYLGFFNGATRLGSFVAVVAGGLLTDRLGFGAAIGAAVVLGLVASAALVVEPSTRQRRAPALAVHAAPTPRPTTPATADGHLVRIAVAFALALVHGLVGAGLVQSSLGLWLGERHGAMPDLGLVVVGVATLTGWLLGVRFLADFAWGPMAGHLSDRLGRLRFVFLPGLLQVLALLWLTMDQRLGVTIVAAAVIFVGATTLQAALDAVVGDSVPPASRTRWLGWYTNCNDLGTATGPALGYALAGSLGLAALYQVTAVLLALALAAFWLVFVWPHRRPDQPPNETR